MSLNDPTPWGLSLDAAASFPAFIAKLRESDLMASVMKRPGIAELISRGMIEARSDANGANWTVKVTERGAKVLAAIEAAGEGKAAPDQRSQDDILQSLFDLSIEKRRIEQRIIEARQAAIA